MKHSPHLGPILCVLVCGTFGISHGAESPRWVAQILRRVPRTEKELAEAFEKSRNSALQISPGESMQLPNYSEQTFYDVTVGGQKEKLKFDFARMAALTFGLTVNDADRENLPSVSKQTILNRINRNFISIQVRPQRDTQSGAMYLYYKPFAAIGGYHESDTEEFSPLMEDSVRDLRGIGLYVPPGTPISAEQLRTFVAVNKTTITDPNDRDAPQPKIQPHYELLFVRGVFDGEKVTLHTFCTSEWRTQLHYMKPYAAPESPDNCAITSVLLFTEYSVAKQSPSAMAQRHTYVHSRASYDMSALNRYAADQGWNGEAIDHLTELLDAIISGKMPVEPLTASAAGQ